MRYVPSISSALGLALALALFPGCARKSSKPADSASAPASAQSSTPGVVGESPSQSPAMIAVSHILIAYKGSLRSTATRTREEALARAQEVLGKAKSPGANFAALADQYSDDPSVQSNHGDLGAISKGMMQADFEAAAWKLEVGEISGVVETPFGFHIIRRNG